MTEDVGSSNQLNKKDPSHKDFCRTGYVLQESSQLDFVCLSLLLGAGKGQKVQDRELGSWLQFRREWVVGAYDDQPCHHKHQSCHNPARSQGAGFTFRFAGILS